LIHEVIEEPPRAGEDVFHGLLGSGSGAGDLDYTALEPLNYLAIGIVLIGYSDDVADLKERGGIERAGDGERDGVLGLRDAGAAEVGYSEFSGGYSDGIVSYVPHRENLKYQISNFKRRIIESGVLRF
jgi:hypothetical protein